MADMGRARPELCVGAVAVDAEQILLIQRGRPPAEGSWSVPGGRVERGETMAEAVVRELREETGLAGVCNSLIGWVERIGPGFHFVIFDFDVTVLDGKAPVAGDDANDAVWCPLAEVAGLPLADGLAEFLHDYGILSPFS
jgi:8-oxo-dGTP diphosphatase